MSNLSRADVGVRTVTETINGKGTSSILLQEWPVVSISNLTVNGVVLSVSPSYNSIGYTLTAWDGTLPGRAQQLSLRGSSFCRGTQNILCTYVAGYLISKEPQIVAGGKAMTGQSMGAWASDQGITYSTGVALQAVSGAPAVGQYQIDAGNYGGYIFNAADNNAQILINYGFIPSPLNQACVEIAAERYRYRSRIGQSSVSMDGKETASYDLSAVSKYVAMNLQPFKRVTM